MTFDVFKFENQPELPIKSGANFISGYAFKSDDFCEAGIPVVKIKNIQNKVVDLNDSQHIPKNLISQKLEKFILSNGDVLIAMTGQGSVGRVGRLRCPSNVHPIMNQRVGKFLADELTLNRDYLFYVISSEKFEKRLFDLGAGSGQPNLSPTVILSVEIPFPKYRQQLAIAEILNSLDNRITLLRETNSTLEAIAQALFKSWFVDFDPVRAKQEGRQPEGLDEATAALFPDAFEESELGLMPRGWRIGCIDDLCDKITNGGTPSRSKQEFWVDGETPWFKTGELSDGFLLQPSERITQLGIQSSSVKVLPKNAVLMAIYAAPTVGRLGVLTEPAAFNQACTGMVAKKEVGTWFLYWSLYFGRDWFNSRANGAAQQNISKAIVSNYKIAIPTADVLVAFNSICDAIHSSVRTNSYQAETLSNLRDTLLPRLISGHLRLPAAEEQIEAATA